MSQKILKYFNDGNSLLDFYKLVVTVLKVKKITETIDSLALHNYWETSGEVY